MSKEEIIHIITDLMDVPEHDMLREFTEKKALNLIDKIEDEQLIITDVSQQRELLGCEHNVITITDRDEGNCADCGIKMTRTWQPNFA